jgi:hypothetical protein
VFTVCLKETSCPWILGTCKAVEALKPANKIFGRSHQKMKISSREEWSYAPQTQNGVLQISVGLVLQKSKNLLITVRITLYNGHTALVSRKDSKLIDIQGQKRSPFHTSQVVLGLQKIPKILNDLYLHNRDSENIIFYKI